MPTYEWLCKVCNEQMELFQTFNDSTVPIHCEQEMSRMFSTPGIILKGTGWGKDK